MVTENKKTDYVHNSAKGVQISKSLRARQTRTVKFLRTLWITDGALMLYINPNTPWNRGSFPYLKDIQRNRQLFLRSQITTDGNPNTSQVCRYLISCACVNLLDLFTKTCSLVFPRLQHSCFLNVCVHISVCVPMYLRVCELAAVSFWAVYDSHSISSSCSFDSHVIGWAAMIGWKRSRRGGGAGVDGQREGRVMEEGRDV